MSGGKINRPPKDRGWVWMTGELLTSDAWRTASGNTHRFIAFLAAELISKKGKQNGYLKAPYRQLVAFGIGARFIAEHIREAERLGLVQCNRGGMRVATTYALTWLPTADGPATDAWREYRNQELQPMTKIRNLPAKGDAALPAKGDADGANLPAKGDADTPQNLPAKGDALLKKSSYQGGDDTKDLSVAAQPAAPAAAPTRPAELPTGDGLDLPAFLDRRRSDVANEQPASARLQ